jgi:uncharacterized protein (TIGR02453 family)
MIAKDTLKFLKDLKDNNNKPWFTENRHRYERAKENFEELVTGLITGISSFDKDIAEHVAKNCTFRQYRDVRFSKDKTPYKINMGAYFNKGGKQLNTAGYYFHLEPGKSIIAGGLWMPERDPLAKVRQEIDYNLEEWKQVISSKDFKKKFPDGLRETDILKRAPKGYDEENPAIHYLKLKSFVISHPVTDEELTDPKLKAILVRSFSALKPFIDFLNRAIE